MIKPIAGLAAMAALTTMLHTAGAAEDSCGAVTEEGYCGVTWGMDRETAIGAYQGTLEGEPEGEGFETLCYYLGDPDKPGVGFMVLEDIVRRVDIYQAGIPTEQGAAVDSTKAEVLSLYPGARLEPNEYTDADNIIVELTNGTRFIFETNFEDSHIENFRAGEQPAVNFIEGCS